MSNKLQIYDAHTDLVMARLRSPKVKDTDEPIAQDYLTDMIEGVCLIRGIKTQEVGVGLMAALLTSQIRQEKLLADLTWEEVAKAFQDGALGKYGEVYGVNVASLYNMLWDYIESQDRAELIRQERELRSGEERKRQARLDAFLEAHPAYAEIVLKNHIANHKQNSR